MTAAMTACYARVFDRSLSEDFGERAPVAFSDDEMMPPHCTERLAQVYGVEAAVCKLLKPGDFGLKSVGHLGAFSRGNAAVWPALVPEG